MTLDRDIEDTRQPPDPPEIDEDRMWDEIYELLPEDLSEFLQDWVGKAEKEHRILVARWRNPNE